MNYIVNLASVLLFLAFVPMGTPAHAQREAIESAAAQFNALPIGDRYEIQMLLIASGYADFVTNENYNRRLFGSITTFQSQNGFAPDGVLSRAQVDRLRARAEPNLASWNLQRVRHPIIGTPLWVPSGFGLTERRTPEGTEFIGRDRVSISFGFFSGVGVSNGHRAIRQAFVNRAARITYEIVRPDFFVVAAAPGDAEHYARFHKLPSGLVGFVLNWDPDRTPDGRWLAVMMSDLFRSAVSLNLDRAPPAPQGIAAAGPPPTSRTNRPEQVTTFSGTGFYVSSEHILTNAHVVQGCRSIEVGTPGGERQVVRLAGRDAMNDLALLVGTKAPAVAALRTAPRLGEDVAVFGFPLVGILTTAGNFTVGNITATAGPRDDSRVLQISAPVQPGNSGGPLLDRSGNVIGVVSSRLSTKGGAAVIDDAPQNVNFAIKIAVAINFLGNHGVKFELTQRTLALEPADIAERAKQITVYVECRR